MRIFTTLIMVFSTIILFSQKTTTLEGYIYESGNRGYMNNVSITAEDMTTEKIVDKTKTNKDGFFKVNVPVNSKIRIYAAKDMFDIKRIETEVGIGKSFIKLEMGRAPGYTFEVTLAEKRTSPNTIVDAITGTRIEVFNNTTRQSVMDLKDHDNPEFQLNLQKGNHYTILIRKNGFLSKRMEAKVDVEGCILCFEGVGRVDPGVSDNLTEGNAFGVLLANVELERIFEGKKMEVQNVYYDTGKWKLTSSAKQELNKVIILMKDNPNLTVELGSHTDSRGKSAGNMTLSNKRAKAAVDYLLRKGDIANSRVISRGYGETLLLNDCGDGAKCPENEHAKNRRTELKIVGITDMKEVKSLAQMKREEYLEAELMGLMDQEQVQAKDEDELKKIIAADKKVQEDVERQINSNEEKEVKKRTTIIEAKEPIQKIDSKEEKKELIEEKVEIIEDVEEVISEEVEIEEVKEIVKIEEELVEEEIEIENEIEVLPQTDKSSPITENNVTDGIKVVLHQSEELLPEDHFIYTRHPKVEIFNNGDGRYFYMAGGFKNEGAAFKFLQSFIRPDKKYKGSFVASITDNQLAVVNQ